MTDTAAAINDIFGRMPGRLDPQAAAGLDAVCTVGEGAHDAPTMTLSMAAADYVGLTSGELDGTVAFMSGKLRIDGDMGLAMRMGSLFKVG